MKIRVALFIVILLFEGTKVSAQWRILTRNVVSGYSFSPERGEVGALTFKDGVVWGGFVGLSYSLDSGRNWYRSSLPAYAIQDISFLNRDTGIVATDSGEYQTTDQGAHWQRVAQEDLCSRVFYASPSDIYLNWSCSHDGGKTFEGYTWEGDMPWAVPTLGMAIGKHGTILLLTAANSASIAPSDLTYSPDGITSWNTMNGIVGPDHYSLDIDSCYGSTLYVVKENYYDSWLDDEDPPEDKLSDICTSTDAGGSWNVTFSHSIPYLAGSFTGAKHAQYAATLHDGTLRSTDHGLTWDNIGGPTNKADSRCLFAVNDNLVFALDSNGDFWETTNSAGDPIPAIDDERHLAQDTLFEQDTVSCGGYIWRKINYQSTACSPHVTSVDFGSVTNDYGLETGPGPDSIHVVFHPTRVGTIRAFLLLGLTDGSTDTVYLQGTNVGTVPFYASPDTLFVNDTVECGDSIEHTLLFHYTNCGSPVNVASLSLIGPDDQQYEFHEFEPDSVTVSFHPFNAASSRAALLIQCDDGRVDTVFLRGYNRARPFQYSTSRSSLFTQDTLSPCDSPIVDTIAFTFSGCMAQIVSQQITGAASADYSAIRLLSSPLVTSDTIIISFKPAAAGARASALELRFDDGTMATIPLEGAGAGGHSLSLSTTDVATDTLGAIVAVPIEIEGLDQPEDVDVTLHYAGTIEYVGSTEYVGSASPTNPSLDIPGEKQSGRSKLHIIQASPNTIAGYSNFIVFNDSLALEYVTFDSLRFSSAVTPCDYALSQDSAVSNIIAPSGCEIPILSNYIHLGIMPQLTLVPNPTAGTVSIISDQDQGLATVSVIDGLGSVRLKTQCMLMAHTPSFLTLPPVGGVYELRIESVSGNSSARVVVIR